MKRPAISLVGPMGSGKSEVGKVLAARLRRDLLDTDEMVIKKDGRAIGQIFAEDGEEGFREIEAQVVAEAAASDGAVIALGGGAVMNPASAAVLKSAGTVVYLKASPQLSALRVGPGEGRPLLAGTDALAALSELLAQREPAYAEIADHIVSAEGTAEEVADRIVAELGEIS